MVEHAWLEVLRPYFARFGAQPSVALEPAYAAPGSEVLILLLDTKPAVISLHFGIPDGFVAPLKAAGLYVVATATNLQEATLCQGRRGRYRGSRNGSGRTSRLF